MPEQQKGAGQGPPPHNTTDTDSNLPDLVKRLRGLGAKVTPLRGPGDDEPVWSTVCPLTHEGGTKSWHLHQDACISTEKHAQKAMLNRFHDLYQKAKTNPPPPQPEAAEEGKRKLKVTRASAVKIRPVHWLWEGRIAMGTMALLAGREGIGKSTIGYDIAARVTKGALEGRYQGTPKTVVVAATEDSWSHTIVPRLMAAGADLDRILRVEVTTADGFDTGLSLPRDLLALEKLVREEDVALIVLDPLMSRLEDLDTHKDSEVRKALEPLVSLADRCKAAILALIHVNKSNSTDPLSVIMGSRAFAAVARSVLFAMIDPDDEQKRYLGLPKNNLGRTDLPTLGYSIESVGVGETEEGWVTSGKVIWGEESSQSIRELLEHGQVDAETRSTIKSATEWLWKYLKDSGGKLPSASIKADGAREGHKEHTLKRALKKLNLGVEDVATMPRSTNWFIAPTSRKP